MINSEVSYSNNANKIFLTWSVCELQLILFVGVMHSGCRRATEVACRVRGQCNATLHSVPRLIRRNCYWRPTLHALDFSLALPVTPSLQGRERRKGWGRSALLHDERAVWADAYCAEQTWRMASNLEYTRPVPDEPPNTLPQSIDESPLAWMALTTPLRCIVPIHLMLLKAKHRKGLPRSPKWTWLIDEQSKWRIPTWMHSTKSERRKMAWSPAGGGKHYRRKPCLKKDKTSRSLQKYDERLDPTYHK